MREQDSQPVMAHSLLLCNTVAANGSASTHTVAVAAKAAGHTITGNYTNGRLFCSLTFIFGAKCKIKRLCGV